MIDIVIVNWNSGRQLKECIDSVLAADSGKISSVVVVDNGSTDSSVEFVDELTRVELVRVGDNVGFGAGCNIGAKLGNSPYVLFLNPDTVLQEDSLTTPLAFMESPDNQKVAICGIQLVDDRGQVSRTCARAPTLLRFASLALGLDKVPGFKASGMAMKDWPHDKTCEVDQVMGAFFFCRRKPYESCDGFDERFFVYFEEVDVSIRSKLAGWQSWYIVEARAFHAGGGTSRQVKVNRLFYSLRSRLLYGFKHFPHWQAWLLLVFTNAIEPFTRSVWCLSRGDLVGVKHTWAAYRMLWRAMGHILRGEGRFNP